MPGPGMKTVGGKLFFATEAVIGRVCECAVIAAATVMIGCMLLGIFFRYVLDNSLSWTDEAALLCFTWIVFLGAALLVRSGGHVRIDLIDDFLPEPLVRALNGLVLLIGFLLGAYIVWTGFGLIELTRGQTSPAMRYPIWLRYAAFPVSGALFMFFSAFNAVRGFGTHTRREA